MKGTCTMHKYVPMPTHRLLVIQVSINLVSMAMRLDG